ncbi:uncharacterized protein LOC117112417 [Anneissia japonica]|uniref:uncharacterized protein LOC117112417 n=1 Tax=Anneissia japonica TaxID=1529436 RepID=UPI0014259FCA|nr:uncharacterized protein LOC117112417 [Anneissia japonica]
MSAVNIEITGVAAYDPHDVHASAEQWKKWLRSFELYATGKGVVNKKQKKALLLHCAGLAVQDIYDCVTEENGTDEYDVVKTLNKQFVMKTNVIERYRYCFRKLTQNDDETINQFINRLRQQATRCDFDADQIDELIRDHVIEKCKSNKLRIKLLEKGNTLKLANLKTIASTFEMSEQQAKEMSEGVGVETPSVNAVRNERFSRSSMNSRSKSQAGNSNGNRSSRPKVSDSNQGTWKCFRCGKEGHFARHKCCPARGKQCTKCKLPGHFAVCKSKVGRDRKVKRRGGGIRNVQSENEDDYAFGIRDDIMHINSKATKVNVCMDVHKVEMIIDSGATANIIDKDLWQKLKCKQIKCKSELTNRKLYAYGSTKPLELLGKFTTNVS